jgi:hypothetical protein
VRDHSSWPFRPTPPGALLRAGGCLLALLSLAAMPSAERVLAGEPPELVERLHDQRLLVLEDVGGDGPESFIVAYVLFEQPRDVVIELLRQAERQTEYRPELDRVETVERLADGRIDEQAIRIVFTTFVYRLRYHEKLDDGRFEWALDETFDNDLARFEGFWELSSFESAPGRTLARFGSNLDVGPAVPRFLQQGLSRRTVFRYLGNCREWIDSGGEWRP